MGFSYYDVIHSRKVRYNPIYKNVSTTEYTECSAFSPVVLLGTPLLPHPHASVTLLRLVGGGGGGPSSDEGTDTVVLYEYMYFVVSTDGSWK